MYTLISHGSRIQVAQFHYWPDSPSSERSDNPPEEKKTGDKEKMEQKPFDYQTAQSCTRKNAEAEKNYITSLGDPTKNMLNNIDGIFGISTPGKDLAQSSPNTISTGSSNPLIAPIPKEEIALTSLPPIADTAVSNTPEKAKPETYTVNKGDTLSKIAQANGISVAELATANRIADINKIQVGQVLNMPASAMTPNAVASAPAVFVPAMPAAKINTAPNPQKNTVASKPTEAPKVEAKSTEDQLAAAGTRLGTAIDVLGKFPENKVAQDMKSEAEATIAKLKAIRDKEEVVRNKEEAAKKYAKSSPGNQILFDYQAALKSLIADSIKPGFTKTTEYTKKQNEATIGVFKAELIVENEVKIGKLTAQEKTITGSAHGAPLARININKDIATLRQNNDADMVALKGTPVYASIQANKSKA